MDNEERRAVTISFLQHGIAVLRMQKGENRINHDFIEAFNSCLDEVERNTSCRGLVTTGEGKFFSNGLDIDWLQNQTDRDQIKQFFAKFKELLVRLLTFPVPTVAAINGHCFAGGAFLALAHDLRVMNSQRGWFCINEVFIEVRLAHTLDVRPIPFLFQLTQSKVSSAVTCRNLLVFGQRFTGQEAESAGLIDKVALPPLVEKESQRLLGAWLGKKGFQRESLQNMKRDVYADVIKVLHTSKL